MQASVRPPWRLWLGLLLAAAGFAALGWWTGQRALLAPERPPPPGLIVVELGGLVPDLRLSALNGGDGQPLAKPGRTRLINYWASWCAPCRDELPFLDAYARRQGEQGVEVLGIALDDADAARAFLAEVPVGFPSLVEPASEYDSSVQLGNARGVLPFTVLIDGQGRLRQRHYGAFADAQAVADWVAAAGR